MIRIYADFNARDAQGRAILTIPGSLPDIEQNRDALVSGLRVVLYTPEEFELEATLEFAEGWVGVPDFSTIRYYK